MSERDSGLALAAAAGLAGLAGGMIGGLLASPQAAPARQAAVNLAPPSAVQASFAEVAARALPAVVHVSVFGAEAGLPATVDPLTGDPESPRLTEGSGFLVGSAGEVVTSRHVARGPGPALVRLADRREFVARFVAADPATDLALLRIDQTGLPALRFGDSDRLQVGDPVCALGHPFRFDHSLTCGVLSGRARKLFDRSFDAYLQTDAAINPGNSGGPILDLAGEVVGVSTAVSARGQGLAFAVPGRIAATVVEALRRSGRVTRGFLGAHLRDVDADLASLLGLPRARGALIVDVAATGPAATADLRPYDVVIGVDGERVADADALVGAIAGRAPGRAIQLDVFRDGRALTAAVTLGERVAPIVRFRPQMQAGPRAALPLLVEAGAGGGRAGVVVRRVLRADPGLDQLAVGDVVLELNRVRTPDVPAWNEALARLAPGQAAFLYVHRARAGRHALVKLRADPGPDLGER